MPPTNRGGELTQSRLAAGGAKSGGVFATKYYWEGQKKTTIHERKSVKMAFLAKKGNLREGEAFGNSLVEKKGWGVLESKGKPGKSYATS